jgi:hypothetical protein
MVWIDTNPRAPTMQHRFKIRLRSAMTALCLIAGGATSIRADGAVKQVAEEPTLAPEKAQTAVDRGLEFLQTDAASWRKEHTCATCHHGTMTVWALSEAKSQGYPVDAGTLRDLTHWTKERLASIDKPRDTRPGWNMVNTPAVYLALMALAVPGQEVVSGPELDQIGRHLLRHQETDGSWAWSIAPAKNRPPPVFESDEVVTLMAYMALGSHSLAGATEKTPAGNGRAQAAAWLKRHKQRESTQATALQLLREVREGKTPSELAPGIDRLLHLQHDDGGWGQERELKSDAYGTGQALYFLSLAGVPRERKEIRRGAAFLIASQNKDGSWAMTSRAHPGAKPMTNPVPITYFGSAWGTLGLMRSLPKPAYPLSSKR